MRRLFFPWAAIALGILPMIAHAQQRIFVICTGLAGCGGEGELFTHAITAVLSILVTIAAGASLLFVVWGGFQFMLLFGDEGKKDEAKNTIKHALIGLAVTLFAGAAVGFVSTQFYGGPANDPIVAVMEAAVRILITVCNVFFLIALIYAGYLMVMGKEDFAKGEAMIKWAIIGAIIVNVSRSIVDAFLGIAF